MSSSPTLAEPMPPTTPAVPSNPGALNTEQLQTLEADFSAKPAYKIAQNALTQTTVDDIALNRSVVTNTEAPASWMSANGNPIEMVAVSTPESDSRR